MPMSQAGTPALLMRLAAFKSAAATALNDPTLTAYVDWVRGGDFDRDFQPRRPDVRERWRRVERAFPEAGFPPIVVYQLGDAYFVIDGHHRVAIARQDEYSDSEPGRAQPPSSIDRPR